MVKQMELQQRCQQLFIFALRLVSSSSWPCIRMIAIYFASVLFSRFSSYRGWNNLVHITRSLILHLMSLNNLTWFIVHLYPHTIYSSSSSSILKSSKCSASFLESAPACFAKSKGVFPSSSLISSNPTFFGANSSRFSSI